MVKGKVKLSVWVLPETKDKIAQFYKADNCTAPGPFVDKAVEFYAGFLTAQDASQYLPRVLDAVMDGHFKSMKNKLGRLLFKYAVEANISNHILAYDTDIDLEQLERLRNRSVREVQESNGEISFKDNLKFQKSV